MHHNPMLCVYEWWVGQALNLSLSTCWECSSTVIDLEGLAAQHMPVYGMCVAGSKSDARAGRGTQQGLSQALATPWASQQEGVQVLSAHRQMATNDAQGISESLM